MVDGEIVETGLAPGEVQRREDGRKCFFLGLRNNWITISKNAELLVPFLPVPSLFVSVQSFVVINMIQLNYAPNTPTSGIFLDLFKISAL